MLSVAVHKDIAEYQPKIVGKMTMRTLVSITGALSVSVLAGLYIYFVLGLNVSDCTYFIYAVSLPFWCVGFVKPCGMPFEQFAPLWLKANFTNDRIFYKPSMRLAGLLSESENSKQKGTIYGKTLPKAGKPSRHRILLPKGRTGHLLTPHLTWTRSSTHPVTGSGTLRPCAPIPALSTWMPSLRSHTSRRVPGS